MSAVERFREWVAEQTRLGLSRTQVAASIGCSEGALSRVLNARRKAGGQIAANIERRTAEWTKGPIRAVDWYPEEDERVQPAKAVGA